jgi:hypothetical protein
VLYSSCSSPVEVQVGNRGGEFVHEQMEIKNGWHTPSLIDSGVKSAVPNFERTVLVNPAHDEKKPIGIMITQHGLRNIGISELHRRVMPKGVIADLCAFFGIIHSADNRGFTGCKHHVHVEVRPGYGTRRHAHVRRWLLLRQA